MGNLRSVAKSLEAVGARVAVSDDRRVLERCGLLVLPGQGKFDTAMSVLRSRGLVDFVRSWVREGRPYLGICLGLQLLFEGSEESPGRKGLCLLPGRVRRFRPSASRLKVPHMGWNQAVPVGGASRLLSAPDHFYFVHSYFADPEEKSAVCLETDYGRRFCSAVAWGRLVATQFHPEKSGRSGLRLLKNVLAETGPC